MGYTQKMKKKLKKILKPQKRYKARLSIFDIICLAFGRILFWTGLFLTIVRVVGLFFSKAKSMFDMITSLLLGNPITSVIVVFCILCLIYLFELKHEK